MNDLRVGLLGIIVKNRECTSSKVNQVLSDHAELIVGRMGVPYDKRNISFISLMIDGERKNIDVLLHSLSDIKGISVSLDLVEIPSETGCSCNH